MPDRKLRPVMLEDVRLFSRNFEGAPTKYNPKGGVRRFCVFIDQETAHRLADEGWRVKTLNARDEDDEDRNFLEVEVKFGKFPPRIVMIGSTGKTELNQENCKLLDWAPATNVDLVIRPYEWEVNEERGVKAYLKSIFYTIYEDELDLKYANVPDSSTSAMFHEVGTEFDDD